MSEGPGTSCKVPEEPEPNQAAERFHNISHLCLEVEEVDRLVVVRLVVELRVSVLRLATVPWNALHLKVSISARTWVSLCPRVLTYLYVCNQQSAESACILRS